jgi:hypothetical protein
MRLSSYGALAFACAAAASLSGCSIYTSELFSGEPSGGGSGSGGSASGGSANTGGAVLGGSTSGGADTGGGTATGASNGTGASSTGGTLMFDLIDDFEDNDVTVIYTTAEKRNGHWDVANDGAGGSMSPAVGFSQPEDISADPPYSDSVYGLHMSGSGFSLWGASLNVSLLASGAYDASKFTGVSFWAKAGSSGIKKVAVRLVSGDTDPRGGICQSSDPATTATYCFDHYFSDVTLTTSWKQFTVPFSDFHQKNVGMQFTAIDTAHAYGFEFFFGAGQTFDIWVDDFAFTTN